MKLRGKLRIRDRLIGLVNPDYVLEKMNIQEQDKLRSELRFWVEEWIGHLSKGSLWTRHREGYDSESIFREVGEWDKWKSKQPWNLNTLRNLESRAQFLRVSKELKVDGDDYFRDKRVMNIGPGLVGFLEASGAALGVAIEPLSQAFGREGLLMDSSRVLYIASGAENVPLPCNSFDVVLSRNNLDHVQDPEGVVSEIYRVLKSDGEFALIVDLEEHPTPTEPHAFNEEKIHALLHAFQIVEERVEHYGRTHEGRLLIGRYRKS